MISDKAAGCADADLVHVSIVSRTLYPGRSGAREITEFRKPHSSRFHSRVLHSIAGLSAPDDSLSLAYLETEWGENTRWAWNWKKVSVGKCLACWFGGFGALPINNSSIDLGVPYSSTRINAEMDAYCTSIIRNYSYQGKRS